MPSLSLDFKIVAQVQISGTGYRATKIRYSRPEHLLSGTGAATYGGRWNPKGVNTLYLSLSPETALAEFLGNSPVFQPDLWPLVLNAVEFQNCHVIDLTSEAATDALSAAGVPHEKSLQEDWNLTVNAGQEPLGWHIARSALRVQAGGLIVPSTRDPQGKNLVLYLDHLNRGALYRVRPSPA